MSRFISKAEYEIGKYCEVHNCKLDEEVYNTIMAMLKNLDDQGHSGFSVGYVNPFLKSCIANKGNVAMVDGDEYGNMVRKGVLELYNILITAKEEHRALIMELFTPLSLQEPTTKLTFTDDEFSDEVNSYDPDATYKQNKRNFAVFKQADGTITYSEAVIFRNPYISEDTRELRWTSYTGGAHLADKVDSRRLMSSAVINVEAYNKHKDIKLKRFYVDTMTGPVSDEHVIMEADKVISNISKFYTPLYFEHKPKEETQPVPEPTPDQGICNCEIPYDECACKESE